MVRSLDELSGLPYLLSQLSPALLDKRSGRVRCPTTVMNVMAACAVLL